VTSTVHQEVLRVSSSLHTKAAEADLRLEISVYVAQLVELVHTHKHLRGVKLGVFLLEHPRVVE